MDMIQISGTSARKLDCKLTSWNLWKVDDQSEHMTFALTAPNAGALPTVARVMHALLDGSQIAMICENDHDPFSGRFLAYLNAMCDDGRILKQGTGSAFIAVTDSLEENLLSASLLGAQAEGASPRFRFVGFREEVPREFTFSALLEHSRGHGLEVVFEGTEEMTLRVSFDPQQYQPQEISGAMRNAINAAGGELNLRMQ